VTHLLASGLAMVRPPNPFASRMLAGKLYLGYGASSLFLSSFGRGMIHFIHSFNLFYYQLEEAFVHETLGPFGTQQRG